MFYFVYGADRPGSLALRYELTEAHWAYMDGYDAALYARGPVLTADREGIAGSLHIVDVPSDEAARAFAGEDPYRRGGVFERVDVYRFEDRLGRSMWEFPGGDGDRFLVMALDGEDAPAVEEGLDRLIVYGTLRRLDGGVAGSAACVQGLDAALRLGGGAGAVVRPWRFGGRPAPG
ncbi:YciI family protein [Dactylosporangium sp. CA-139066]|uniref:YciI family protein n=1 Tax=Dactylosporangium sp. CA-139066 TaxID=3239930 RepID=UPI003D9106E7